MTESNEADEKTYQSCQNALRDGVLCREQALAESAATSELPEVSDTYQKYLPWVPAERTFLPVNAAATSGPVVPTLPNTLASSMALAFLIVFPTRWIRRKCTTRATGDLSFVSWERILEMSFAPSRLTLGDFRHFV